MKIFILITLFFSICQAGVRSLLDVQSAILNSNGTYTVTCFDGIAETVSPEELKNGYVCGTKAPENILNVEAIFTHPDGEFYVLCKNNSWEKVTVEAFQNINACNTEPNNLIGFPLIVGKYVDQRPIEISLTYQGPDILIAWPSTADLANGLYTCTNNLNVCTHKSGYRILVTGKDNFTWEYSEGSNDYQFNLKQSEHALAGKTLKK